MKDSSLVRLFASRPVSNFETSAAKALILSLLELVMPTVSPARPSVIKPGNDL